MKKETAVKKETETPDEKPFAISSLTTARDMCEGRNYISVTMQVDDEGDEPPSWTELFALTSLPLNRVMQALYGIDLFHPKSEWNIDRTTVTSYADMDHRGVATPHRHAVTFEIFESRVEED